MDNSKSFNSWIMVFFISSGDRGGKIGCPHCFLETEIPMAADIFLLVNLIEHQILFCFVNDVMPDNNTSYLIYFLEASAALGRLATK
jgi:hypothetical protein